MNRPAIAIMVAGFSSCDNWAVDIVDKFKDAHGFLGEAYDAVRYSMDRYRWSVHWAELLDKSTTEKELWRYAVILSRVVDGRHYYVRRAPDQNPLLANFAKSIGDLIQNRVKKWRGKRSDKLFGMDAPDTAFLR